MTHKFLSTTAILFAIVSLSLCSVSGQQPDAPRWDDPDAIRVSRTKIVIKESDQVEISVDIPGTITKLTPNARGGVVKKGQVVVELDDALVKAQLVELEAKATSTVLIKFAEHALESAELKLKNRQEANKRTLARSGKTLYTPDEMRELELDVVKAQAELDKSHEDQRFAQLAMETKEVELSQFTREATMSGIVTEMHKKSVGSAVRQGDPIMTIVNLDRVTAQCVIDMEFEDRVSIGDTVLIRRTKRSNGRNSALSRSFGNPDDAQLTAVQPQANDLQEVFVGKVSYISPIKVADNSNSFEIEAVIQNKSTGVGKFLLREGSFVEAVVISPR